MPYIGNPITSGENNSFKVLDDITSYTLTFNGSSASIVSVANNTITYNSHRFITGQRVTYNTTGTTITGLTAATAYFIIKEDQNTIKLATTYANAINNTAIDLTGLGTGTTHTINVAFDGVNTKFKATYDNGTKAQITRAAQLTLSVNGVIQQPQDTTSPTNGFGIDLDSVIIFSVAPLVTDIFWGNLVANNFPTFDISDNTVDSFTGTGSLTAFTLSKEPANSQNLLVTIDGVVQYPNDANVTRAYSVVSNVLTFEGAPGNGTAIQVRHIGFAGATSSSVTGFYGRTGNVGLTTADTVSIGAATIGTGGIGTSLLVQGNARITGILTVGTGSITIDGVNNTISGVINTNATGVSTVGSLSIGNTSVISSGRQLQNIASLDATTTATIESAVANAPNTFTDLSVSGISTLGVTSSTNLTTQQLNVSGISTLGITSATNLTSQSLSVSGISTLGITSSTNLTAQSLSVSGISTLGITSSTNLTAQSLSVSGISTFTNGPILVGTATSTGTASQRLQVTGGAYVSGNLGIGTTNPARKLDVVDSGASGSVIRSKVTTNNGGYLAYEALNSSGTSVFSVNHNGGVTLAGNVIFASGQGLDFSATANSSGTMTSELLNDYEEGTWTATLGTFSGTAPTTTVTATGQYTKIGRLVHVEVQFSNVSTAGASGDVKISGLPFDGITGNPANGTCAAYLFDFPSGLTNITFQVSGSNISFYISGDNVAWGNLLYSAGSGRYLSIAASYIV